MDEVSLRIDAPADRLYELVTDVAGMGRWSPECTGGCWIDGATGPAVGARFKGSNKAGVMRWSTRCDVTKLQPGRVFEWEVKESGMRWGYRFDPQPDGSTVVTEYRDKTKATPFYVRAVQRSGLLGRDREGRMRQGMQTTLERLKAAAEA